MAFQGRVDPRQSSPTLLAWPARAMRRGHLHRRSPRDGLAAPHTSLTAVWLALALAVVAPSPAAAEASDALIILGVTFSGFGFLAIVYWCSNGGLAWMYRSIVTRELSERKVKSYRSHHQERVSEASANSMREALTMGVFDEDGDELSSDDEWDGGDWLHREDPADGTHTVYYNMHKGKKQQLTIQTNRPLAQAMAVLEKDVYYEATVEDMEDDSKISVGWATSPYPPMAPVGHIGHSIGIVSAGEKLMPNTRDPVTGSIHPLGTTGKLVFKTSDEHESGGIALDEPYLTRGDTVGCGYKQYLDPDAKHPRLMIKFYFKVNNRVLEIPDMYCCFYAINGVFDVTKTRTFLQGEGSKAHIHVGLLANGVAFPTCGVVGQAELKCESALRELRVCPRNCAWLSPWPAWLTQVRVAGVSRSLCLLCWWLLHLCAQRRAAQSASSRRLSTSRGTCPSTSSACSLAGGRS